MRSVDSLAARQVFSLDAGWKFHLGEIDPPLPNTHIAAYMGNKAGWARGAAKPSFDDSDWREVNLPHDWSVEGKFDPNNHVDAGFLPRGIAWYRRHFTLDESDRGKYLAIAFDGVATHCTVFLNGHLLHRNFCGYTPFTIDISDVANFGEEKLNCIAVRVDAAHPEGWWYEGAGMYRHVWLIKSPPLHTTPDGILVRPIQKDQEIWHADARTTLENSAFEDADCKIEFALLDPESKTVTGSDQVKRIGARAIATTGDSLVVRRPAMWSIDSPTLYSLRVRIHSGDCKTGV